MQGVDTVVLGELVLRAVEREPAFRDAIAITADEGAEVWSGWIPQIAVDRVESEHDVVQLAVAVRHAQRGDYPAVCHNRRFHALGIGQRVEFYRLPIAGFAEGPALG